MSCAWTIHTGPPRDPASNVLRYATHSGEGYVAGEVSEGLQMSGDFIGFQYHDFSTTHLDSLCHVFWNGQMYNGFPSKMVSAEKGARAGAIDLLSEGVVTRGVLLDIARLRGVPWLEPGEPIFPEEFEAAEKARG